MKKIGFLMMALLAMLALLAAGCGGWYRTGFCTI